MNDQIDTEDSVPQKEPARPDPARLDTPQDPTPPRPGSAEALAEERKTAPARTRGVTNI